MRKTTFFISALIFLIILVACNETDHNEQTNIEETVTPVETVKIETGDLIIEQTIYGHLAPHKQTPVMLQQGEITDVKVENGDHVKKDERLGTIRTEMGSIAIKSPIEGEVAQLTLEKDDVYHGEEPFAMIYDDETIAVHFFVTPELKGKFKVGKSYKVMINEKRYDGKINSIEELPNEAGQFEIIAHIDNEKGKILLGSIAEVIVEDIRVKDTILIPTEALITESDETYVFIAQDSVAKKVIVDVLETQSDEVAVDGDLQKDDEVITSGQFLLTDGSEIDVVKDGK